MVYVNSGKKGNCNKELNNPEADTIYFVDNKIKFETDHLARTSSVETDLDLVKGKDRNGYQQITAAKKGKLVPYTKKKMDQGGHIIANRFGRPGEKINLVPQDAENNLGGGEWNETYKQGDLRKPCKEILMKFAELL
ncbi:DNA/RNA non-specific endonuclease [Fluviispira vulneris]|uniref:DNA/RNA non-specific endonuclease n=1 Tax=Fluviispira vulneris TaxID=2763012 RepID=UPI001644E6FF|nr:DNA/RNA non-specific endonuclease [Fluviispira vulneris]